MTDPKFIWDDYMRAHLHKQNELHKINDQIDIIAARAKRVKEYDPKTNEERTQKAILMVKIVTSAKPWITKFNQKSLQPIAPRGTKENPIKLKFKK